MGRVGEGGIKGGPLSARPKISFSISKGIPKGTLPNQRFIACMKNNIILLIICQGFAQIYMPIGISSKFWIVP